VDVVFDRVFTQQRDKGQVEADAAAIV